MIRYYVERKDNDSLTVIFRPRPLVEINNLTAATIDKAVDEYCGSVDKMQIFEKPA